MDSAATGRLSRHLPGHAQQPGLEPGDEAQPPALGGTLRRYLRREISLLEVDGVHVLGQRVDVCFAVI